MTRFYSNRRPETRIFLLKLDEFQIAWWRNAGKEEGTGSCYMTFKLINSLCVNCTTSLFASFDYSYQLDTFVMCITPFSLAKISDRF